MKTMRITILTLACMLLLTACPTSKKLDGEKLLKEHHYNFSHFRKVYYKGLTTRIPKYFINEYGKSYLSKEEGLSLFSPETSIYFSIERFTQEEAEDIQFGFEEGSELLDVVNTHYGDLRANSLDKPKVSITFSNPKKSKLKGFYQFIQGKQNSYDYYDMMYMFTTVEKKIDGERTFFVIQLVAPEELAKYLSDDFKRLIYSLK